MATKTSDGNRSNTPDIGGWLAKGFISQEQHDAYPSKDSEKLKRADKEAEEKAIQESIKNLTPNSSRRTNATVPNRVGNPSNSSNSGANPRNAKAVSQKNQKTRATLTPEERTFDSIRTTMESRGFIGIKPFEVMNGKTESAILIFLRKVKNNATANHSDALKKYQQALGAVYKIKKDSDEPELPDFQGNIEYDEVVKILDHLKNKDSHLGDLKIVLQWAEASGTPKILNLGKGNQEVHLVITPDKNFEAFFRTSK